MTQYVSWPHYLYACAGISLLMYNSKLIGEPNVTDRLILALGLGSSGYQISPEPVVLPGSDATRTRSRFRTSTRQRTGPDGTQTRRRFRTSTRQRTGPDGTQTRRRSSGFRRTSTHRRTREAEDLSPRRKRTEQVCIDHTVPHGKITHA